MSLGASVAMAQAAERAAPFSIFAETFDALMMVIMAPAGDPISPPIPRAKPDRAAKTLPAPAPGIVAQCGYATIVAELDKDGKTPIFRASFAESMADEMVQGGCGQFFQGCNVCNVRYEGCDEAERAACTDAACLEKTCERKVICSAKTCTIKGKAPGCTSRIARTQCLKPLFQ